jgi:hypothetical protein
MYYCLYVFQEFGEFEKEEEEEAMLKKYVCGAHIPILLPPSRYVLHIVNKKKHLYCSLFFSYSHIKTCQNATNPFFFFFLNLKQTNGGLKSHSDSDGVVPLKQEEPALRKSQSLESTEAYLASVYIYENTDSEHGIYMPVQQQMTYNNNVDVLSLYIYFLCTDCGL